uniref:Uncharacterized protein n=1 Tax=Anopheles minimus TaxID=112268 RepID=A0A182W1G4_9DIPT
MLSGRIRRRALALLGALLLVILVWPPCCATMPKPWPVVPPSAPWDIVPPARPHPAAAVLPVQPLQPWPTGGVVGAPKRAHVPIGRGSERQPEQEQRQEPAESESRKSRRVSEFYRFLRALSPIAQPAPAAEPNERRQSEVSAAAVQLNLPSRENSAVRDARDYLIEPIDKNKSQSSAVDPSQDTVPGRVRTRFDDTDPPVRALVRSKREALPTNPHRHQHQLGPVGPLNGTGVWHGRRGGGGGGGRHHHHPHQQQQQQQQHRNNESNLERNERSANLSHITGATRKIQLFIKNRYIQLLPDGTVNGTYDDLSDYSEYPSDRTTGM